MEFEPASIAARIRLASVRLTRPAETAFARVGNRHLEFERYAPVKLVKPP
jgi:hypothetical protein